MITNKTEVVAQLVGRATGMSGGLAGAWNENAPLLVGFTAAGGRDITPAAGAPYSLGRSTGRTVPRMGRTSADLRDL